MELKKYLPKPHKVREHCTANDLWVSFFGRVYDLTQLVQSHCDSREVNPLIEAAGQDISHWFQSKTKNPRSCVDVTTGKHKYYCPQGRFLHLPESPEKEELGEPLPWWRNHDYSIGLLTQKSRLIRIINVLSEQESTLEVPQEQTINEILERYLDINYHARSYTWKRHGKCLDMQKTLSENGIRDEDFEYEELEVPATERYIPAIHLYFNDDLSIA